MIPESPTATNTFGDEDEEEVVKPLEVSYWLLIAFPAVSFTPVVILVKYVVPPVRLSDGSSVNVWFELEPAGSEDILTQVLKLSDDTLIVPAQFVSYVLVVTDVVSIASENVTVMLSVIDTELWLSAVAETEVTVGAVVSVVSPVLELELSSFAYEDIRITMLTIRTDQDNKFLYSFLLSNVEEVGLKSYISKNSTIWLSNQSAIVIYAKFNLFVNYS